MYFTGPVMVIELSPEYEGELIEDDLLEGVIEEAVKNWIRDGGQHAEEEGQSVAHGDDYAPLGEDFRAELVEEGVEDEGAPAHEEDGSDAAEQDVGSTPTLVHFRMLAWRPKNNKGGDDRISYFLNTNSNPNGYYGVANDHGTSHRQKHALDLHNTVFQL